MSNGRLGLRTRPGIIRTYTEGAVDSDVVSFLNATGINDITQINAITQLVADLKNYGLWAKMKSIYPFVGGEAAQHKFNLKDARDLDAAFRLVFSGGITHNSNGITGNGSNAFCDSKLIPSSHLTNNNLSITLYSRTTGQTSSNEMGCSGTSFLPIISLSCRATNNTALFDGYDFTTHRLTPTSNDGSGLFHGNILTSTNQKFYRNGSQIASQTAAQTQTQPSQPLYILARNDNGTAANYSSRNLAFASIGDGLTDTEASNLYTSVQAFQTTLGRQV